MIKTKIIHLSPRELFAILIVKHFKKRWWFFMLILLMAVVMTMDGVNDTFEKFFAIYAILYPLLVILQFWIHVKSKKNKMQLLARHYEIDQEKIDEILDENTHSPIKLTHFIKTDIIRNTYLLYLTKTQFLYIPKDSFETESDIEWFENEVFNAIGH